MSTVTPGVAARTDCASMSRSRCHTSAATATPWYVSGCSGVMMIRFTPSDWSCGGGEGARRGLPARHRHRGVVEDLVGDVDPGGHRVVDSELAGVEERTVPDVLE